MPENAWYRESRKQRRYPRAAAVLLLLLVASLLLAAAAAAAQPGGPGNNPEKKADPATVRTVPPVPVTTLPPQPAPTVVRVSPTATVPTQPPAAVPARANRTTIVQDLKSLDRPKVTLPSGLFLVLLAVAGIGVLAIVYFLLRRRAGVPADLTAPPRASRAGTPTLIGETNPPLPANAAPPAAGPPSLFPASLEKRFANAEFIGEGGIARVFRARNVRTGMTVAVKVPARYDEAAGTHFTRDIITWQGLEHPNIVRIWSSNILPVPYIEMEYAPSSLAAIRLPVSEERAVGLVLGVARGIAYAHERGIVHRDIKPENILLSEDGVPKITDWGLAKAMSDPRKSSILGFSPSYAAPEQLAPHRFGRPGPATDIYQLGMLLCELLTGTTAFRQDGMLDLTIATIEDPPVVGEWEGLYGEELRSVILRCLEKRPEDRYASVADLIADLEYIDAEGW